MAVRGTVDQGAGGTLVTSVSGTTNQITVTPTTGAAVVSIASGFVATPTQGGKPSNRFTSFTFVGTLSTTSATAVMGGFGSTWALTPATTGKVRVRITGNAAQSNAIGTTGIKVNYGTGTAPTAGAATTGTSGTTSEYQLVGVISSTVFAVEFEVSALTLATAYWFDVSMRSATAGTATIAPISIIIEEF